MVMNWQNINIGTYQKMINSTIKTEETTTENDGEIITTTSGDFLPCRKFNNFIRNVL